MQKKMKQKRFLFQLASLLLPLLILIPVFVSMGVAPFGKSNLLVSDLGTQYVPFFSYFKEMVLGNGSPLYSFSSGMGDDFLPLAAYYLMSPFNLIFLVTPKIYLATAVTLVIMLKICFISWSLVFYLSRTYQKVEVAQLFFALGYAFCGFVGIYLYNIMWLDALIWLPIVALSIQYLVDRNKKLFYCFSLFAVIVSNYYLGYMTCLFALSYFIYWTMRQTEFKNLKDYFQQTMKKWLSFITYSIIGAGLTSFILIPALLGMLQTGKSAVDWKIFLPFPTFGLDFFLQLGIENTDFTSRLDHLPTIFIGSLFLLLAVSYFFIGSISKKEKWLSFSMLAVLFLSFWLQSFNTVWHMFQLTAGFPYRNAYMFSFFLILLGYSSWQKRSELSERLILKISGTLIGLLAIGYVYSWLIVPWLIKNSKLSQFIQSQSAIPLQPYLFWVSAGAIILTSILLIWGKSSKMIMLLLFATVTLEIGYNFHQMLADTPLADNTRFQVDMKNYTQLLNEMDEKDQGLYRIKNTIKGVDNGYNESFLYNYHSIPYYSSTLNEDLRDSLWKLGLFSKNERRISDVGQTPFLDYLFNTRYVLGSYQAKGTELAIAKSEFGQILPLHPEMETSIGYMVPSEFSEIKLKEERPFDNQNRLVGSIIGSQKKLFQSTDVTQSVATNAYMVTVKTTGPTYLYLPKIKFQTIRLYVDGKEISPQVAVTNQALINLGEFSAGKQFYLEIKSQREVIVESENIQTLDDTVYREVTNRLQQTRLAVSSWSESNIQGEVQVEKNQDVLFVSIPHDTKWKAEVDGKPVALKKVLGDFIGVPLDKGTHTISLTYYPEGFKIGTWVSYICVFWLIGLVSYNGWKKNKRKK
ncbi:YfhO family protein [Carnobacterium gallinarum]|uniref:YfhO family protein n=1 Tax=Carnobacterium gallinarum TaxID=2749 RepID=UPI00054FE5BD|nr:YfhO family protein [Carnobacterium gallinarum]